MTYSPFPFDLCKRSRFGAFVNPFKKTKKKESLHLFVYVAETRSAKAKSAELLIPTVKCLRLTKAVINAGAGQKEVD